MIFHMESIASGTGIDYDSRCIDFANYFKQILKADHLSFFKKDLNSYVIDKEYDIIFLLSLGSWVKNWKNLYKQSIEKTKIIILEINNVEEGKPQIEFFEKNNCKIKKIIDASEDDITNNLKRKTFLIEKIIA